MRGSTTAIVGANGALQKGYSYDVFGSLEESGNVSFLNEVTFTGSVTDTSTGLQYMNARFYDPNTGRFISQDSYSGNPYDPWTQHLYTYCGNNPTNMVDPTGHFFVTALIVGAAIGCAVGLGLVGYSDYKDDGEIFNGSKTVGDYVKGAAVGTVIGAAAGATVGYAVAGAAATASLGTAGTMAFNAGYAGVVGMGTNAAYQAATKGIDNVDCTEVTGSGLKSAAMAVVSTGVSTLLKGSGTGAAKGGSPKQTNSGIPSQPKVVNNPEVKAPYQVKSSQVTDVWDDFLGSNQTNINPRTGLVDNNRIFSLDGTRSIRFGNHEMSSMGTTKFHFHQEEWVYDAVDNVINYYNTLIRIC